MDDLEDEISGCRDAYVGAAVTEIAVLRGGARLAAAQRVSIRSSSTSGCRPAKRLSMNSLVKSAMKVPSLR